MSKSQSPPDGCAALISGKQCVAALGKVGYAQTRQKGSHVRLECVGRQPLIVPMHDELYRGTLRVIPRTAGVSVEDFAKRLG